MKIKRSELAAIAVSASGYPKDEKKEIAFVGRSNVGKSSLINGLLMRRNLARTSSSPGKTRTINFYDVNDLFRFVDLPGYGFARVSHAERNKWAEIINEYLSVRENLVDIFLLLDIRHKPTAQDLEMYRYIRNAGFNGRVIVTKADKIAKTKVRGEAMQRAREVGASPSEALAFSTTMPALREDILNEVAILLDLPQENLP